MLNFYQPPQGGFTMTNLLQVVLTSSLLLSIYSTSVVATSTPIIEKQETHKDLIGNYDWDVEVAYQVMLNEGGTDPEATNPEWHYNSKGEKICQGSYGLFQLACIHANDPLNPIELKDAKTNIKMAYELYLKEGWWPWSVCKNGTVDCGLKLK